MCEVLNVEVIRAEHTTTVKIIGNDSRENALHITMSDIVASLSYYANLYDNVGSLDDIDHLGNRRLRLIGELLKINLELVLLNLKRILRRECQLLRLQMLLLKI